LNNPTVSVVIPAYNAARFIRRALDSVLAQTYPATEVLVIDDGSTDETASIVESYRARVTLIRQNNMGASSARNAGIDGATGDLIAFLDADDYWEPQKLERHVQLYRNNANLGLSASGYYTEEPGNKSRCAFCGVFSEGVVRLRGRKAFEWVMLVSTITVVVPKRILGQNRFDEGLETAEDRDLWLRLVAAAPVAFISEPLATAVLEPGSLSRTNVDRDCRNMLRVVDAYRELLGPRQARRQEASVYARWAGRLLSEGRAKEAKWPALQRLRRDPLTLRGWWTLVKASAMALGGTSRSAGNKTRGGCESRPVEAAAR
jgi:glycosyltransferase involved in cell wall biosynthesis